MGCPGLNIYLSTGTACPEKVSDQAMQAVYTEFTRRKCGCYIHRAPLQALTLSESTRQGASPNWRLWH